MLIRIQGGETEAQHVVSLKEYGNVQTFIILLTSLRDLFLTAYVQNRRRKSYWKVKKLQIAITL